jgi:hypothetical protein
VKKRPIQPLALCPDCHGTGLTKDMPASSNNYPPDWPDIAKRIKDAANWQCERCEAHHDPAQGYCLTVHHLDGDKSNCADWNLAALCQRCHLKIQGRVKMDQLFFLELMPISGWFKKHYEGYLASKAAKEPPADTAAAEPAR